MNSLEAMLAQYENNNKPKFEKSATKSYSKKSYFNTFIEVGVNSAAKVVRILPTSDGSTPFTEFYGHKIEVKNQITGKMEWKTFACLKHEKNEPCPFCETREVLLSTGEADDKELAKKYNAKKMYIVKLIERNNEDEGVKFWRFNHDYRKEGIFDKIAGVLFAIKKDITNATNGRDLSISINRNQNNIPVVSSIVSMDPTPLSDDADLVNTWLDDNRTWEDVYSLKSYDYLLLIVKGLTPVWDTVTNSFVAKEEISGESHDEKTSEITMGLESVKGNVVEGKTSTDKPKADKANASKIEDDLPF